MSVQYVLIGAYAVETKSIRIAQRVTERRLIGDEGSVIVERERIRWKRAERFHADQCFGAAR